MNNFYSTGSCAEQLNEHACKNGFQDALKTTNPPERQVYTVTPIN